MIRLMLMVTILAAGASIANTPAHAADAAAAVQTKLEAAKKEMEDSQSLQQFEIQSSSQQTSQKVRSQAEKRLEQQRRDLTRNWGG
jgi:hypothetical protein